MMLAKFKNLRDNFLNGFLAVVFVCVVLSMCSQTINHMNNIVGIIAGYVTALLLVLPAYLVFVYTIKKKDKSTY